MKVLILGANGQLGHRLLLDLSSKYEVMGTVKKNKEDYSSDIFKNCYFNINAFDINSIARKIKDFNPDVVINCIGIVKQRTENERVFYEINSVFPHKLYSYCQKNNSFLIHISSICVWSGDRGGYSDTSPHDALDIYGVSKSLGEVEEDGALTIRTSFIGPEVKESGGYGLLNWFLKQKVAFGFCNEIFSGLTTFEICNIFKNKLKDFISSEEKIYNLSGFSINKFELLEKINFYLNLGIKLIKIEKNICNRSFIGDKFCLAFDYIPKTWDVLIQDMAKEMKREKIYGF